MKTSILKALFGATATVAGLISMTGNANAISLGGATLSIGMECNNDMMAMVLGNSSSSQWQYVNDARGDALGGDRYEFYGMGFMQNATHVYFAINTHDMGLNAGRDTVSNGRTQYNIGYGDLLINTRGTNLATANGNLFGVHFGANSAGVSQVGLYGNVTATSVAGQHYSGHATLANYINNRSYNTATTAGNFFGSLSSEQGRTYFDRAGSNVIGSGTFLSGIEMLTLNQLQAVGYNRSNFQGGQTVAFRIARSSFGPEQSVPEPTTILGLAGIGLALVSGKLRKQAKAE